MLIIIIKPLNYQLQLCNILAGDSDVNHEIDDRPRPIKKCVTYHIEL